MEKSDIIISKQEEASSDDGFQEMLQNLPKERDLVSGLTLYCHQGFWIKESYIKPIIYSSKHFVARDDDIILASCPKSGTTWLKAIAFSVVNRTRFSSAMNNPLLTSSPHDLVPYFDFDLYSTLQPTDLENITPPRLLSTHTPYASLPPSLKSSKCKIVYIYRNPMDLFVSHWHFFPKFNAEMVELPSIEECFDMFCRGVHWFGPFWDHILGFWNASLERRYDMFFLRYEDLKKDTIFYIKQLAEFFGFPFSDEEEKQGVIEEIAKLCSIENMKTLKGNIDGMQLPSRIPNSAFFRKGEVGDWRNYLTPSMVERLEKLIEEKFNGSGLVQNLVTGF